MVWFWLLWLHWMYVSGSHLIQQPLEECITFNRPLRVGVQYEESAEYALAQWNATFGSYLTAFLRQWGCPGASLAAVMHHDELYARVEDQLAGNLAESEWLDLLLVSPALVAGLHRLHEEKVETLATLERVHEGSVVDFLAGVLVRRKDENTFLVDWADFTQPAAQGLKLCAVRHDSFSGFQIQDLEALQQVGLRLEEVFNVTFVLSHDQVVEDVAAGKCAVGTVGSGHLERVATSGLIHPPYTVIPLDTWTEVCKMTTANFPLLHSTIPYPEYGLLRLSDHVPPRLAELVRTGLIAMDDANPAAAQGKHAGFTFPADYHQAELVEYQLDFFGDGRCPPAYERETTGEPLCRLCPRGTFKATEVGLCEKCPVRHYSNVTGATSCLLCEEGFSSYYEGATECERQDNTGYIPISACNHYDNNTLVIAILSVVNAKAVHDKWAPTFETTLNKFLNKFNCYVRMTQLTWEQMPLAVAEGAIDFAFLDPGMYIRLEHLYGLRAKCSVLRSFQGAVTGYMGGVMFRLADRNLDLNSLQDVLNASLSRGLRACPVDHDSFSGWSVQRYEFFKQKIQAEKVFAEILFSESHDESVAMVARGACDVGMAQTNTLERLIHAHAYAHDTFVLINEKHHAHFHELVSTDLYHEWPFAVMPHVEEEIWRKVIIPLLAIAENDEAAIIGEHAGFTDFLSYEEAANVDFQLNLVDAATGLCAPGSARNYSDPMQGCAKCEKGRFNNDGLPVCHACEPGFYGDETGLLKCKRCDKGMITHHFGETHCVEEKELLLYQPIEACANYPNHTLVIGVLTQVVGLLMEMDEELVNARWKPTFEGVLNDYMNRFQCHFKMVALGWRDFEAAMKDTSVDFIFVDSGGYTVFERNYGIKALATVVRFFSGRTYSKEGGVIFARNGSLLSQQATSLKELQNFSATHTNLKLCAVDNESFSGYDIQRYEFFKRGLRLEDIFHEIVFTEENDKIVELVMDGHCDVGMVRTHTIERLLHNGKHEIEDFHILNEQIHQGFPVVVSTSLYHEWPFAVLKHVEQSIWSNVRIPLLGMREFDSAAVKGEYAGFVQAEDYRDEAEVDYQLNLVDPSTGRCAPGSARNYSNPLEPCVKCAKGHFNHDGLPVCHACDLGFYSDERGLLECKRCPPGFITHDFGATHCIEEKDVLVYHPIKECANFTDGTLVVGILATDSKELTHKIWDPTFDATLNDYFNRYACKFRTRALDWHEVSEAVATQSIDLLFADSGLFTELHHMYGLEALASVLRDFNGFLSPHYGGVIFRNASENMDLHNLQDIVQASQERKLRVCPVDNESFAGWHAQWYEFFKAEIDVHQVFGSIEFSESDDRTVDWVASGRCDVGFARTGTLERLVHEERYEIEQFAVISGKQFDGFVQLLSTDLYPEWPIAVLPHIPKAIASVVAIPLLAMRETDYASKAGSHAGFTSAYSYGSASELRYQLSLEPNATCGPGGYRDLSTKLHACRACPPGSFNLNGVGECVLCPVGYDAPNPGSAQCGRCPFGYNTLAPGGVSCVEYSQVIEMESGAVYAVWGISSFLFLFCLLIFGLVVRHRHTKLMKASSASFNMVLILACGIICAGTVLFSLEPAADNWVCSLRWWVPCLAASTVFGTLFSKTYRLYSIFRIYETKQKIPQAIKFKDTRVAGMVASFLAVTCVVLTIFFLVEPPFHVTLQAQLKGQDFYTFVEACDISKFWVPFVFTCYTVVLCGQCWLAFRVRNLPTIFNESKLIAWLLYNTVFVGLVGIMVDFMLDWTQVTAQLMVRTVALLLGSCTPVAVLYGPKLLEIYQEQMNNSKYSSKDQASTKTQQTYESQGGHTLVGADLPTSNVGAALPGKGVGIALNYPIPGQHNKSRVGKSNKSHMSAVSGVSGFSDDEGGDWDVDIMLVPDSDIAGDENFQAHFETNPGTRVSSNTETGMSVLHLHKSIVEDDVVLPKNNSSVIPSLEENDKGARTPRGLPRNGSDDQKARTPRGLARNGSEDQKARTPRGLPRNGSEDQKVDIRTTRKSITKEENDKGARTPRGLPRNGSEDQKVEIRTTRKSITKEEVQPGGRPNSKSKIPALEEQESNVNVPPPGSSKKIPALEESENSLPQPRAHMRHSRGASLPGPVYAHKLPTTSGSREALPRRSTSKEELGNASVHTHQLPRRSTSKEDLASSFPILHLESMEHAQPVVLSPGARLQRFIIGASTHGQPGDVANQIHVQLKKVGPAPYLEPADDDSDEAENEQA